MELLNPITFRFPIPILNSNTAIHTTPIIQIQISHAFSLLLRPLPSVVLDELWKERNFGQKCQCAADRCFFPWNLSPPSRLASATKSAKQKKLGSSGTSPFQDVQPINLDLSFRFFCTSNLYRV